MALVHMLEPTRCCCSQPAPAHCLPGLPRPPPAQTPACTDALQKWVLDMSTHFKSLDQAHLLTVGSEGFWGERDSMRDNNPGAPASGGLPAEALRRAVCGRLHTRNSVGCAPARLPAVHPNTPPQTGPPRRARTSF